MKITHISPDERTFFGNSNFCNFAVDSDALLINTETAGLLRFGKLLEFLDTGSNETLGGKERGITDGFG